MFKWLNKLLHKSGHGTAKGTKSEPHALEHCQGCGRVIRSSNQRDWCDFCGEDTCWDCHDEHTCF